MAQHVEIKEEASRAEPKHPKPRKPRPGDLASGELRVPLPALPPGSHVARASVMVGGHAFRGALANFSGARATAATVVYGNENDAQAFVVDFGAPRAILGLEWLDDSAVITLVLSWMGTGFSTTAAYPSNQAPAPGTPPDPDKTGATEVSFAGIDTQKLFVQLTPRSASIDEKDFPDLCRIITDTLPMNVRASVGGRLPFWSHPGLLNEETEITGLAEALNAVLKDGAADELELTLSTDAPGVIDADAGSFDISRTAAACWGSDTKTGVNLEALEPRAVALPFPVAGTPAVGSVVLELAGKFPPWRAFAAQNAGNPGSLGMRVDSHFSVARRFSVTESAEFHGVALPLRLDGEAAELHLDILADKDGRPVSTKPLASADIKLAAGTGSPQWTGMLLPRPLQLAAATPVWAVLKAKTGRSEWAGVAAAGFDTLFSDEGGLWQRYPAVASNQYPLAQMRILRKPFASEASALITIGAAGQAQPATWSPGAGALTLTLNPPQRPTRTGDTASLPLTFQAAATGVLTIQSATAFYKPEP